MKFSKKNTIILSAAACLILAIFLSYLILNWRKQSINLLKQAQTCLHDGQTVQALQLFYGLKNSPWVNSGARLGHRISALLQGKTTKGQSLPAREDIHIEDYHLMTLLHRLFVNSRLEDCINLAAIGRHYGMNAVNLYYSAALLEKNKIAEARNLFYSLPGRLRYTSTGQRLEEVFQLLRSGAQIIVRDRRGEIAGWVDQGGAFDFYRTEYTSFIQPVVIRQILKQFEKSTATKKNINGIRLSIDLELSREALASLGEHRGSIVLVKPDTGDILAAVSDRGSRRKIPSPAFEQMLEPASISKLITLSAAFRDHLEPNEFIDNIICRGGKKYNGKILWCPAKQGNLRGLNHAMAVSCNTSFADLGVEVGWEKMLNELRLFGYDKQAANPFPLGKIVIPSGDDRSLANLSIGLENTRTTPVHAALITSVFANDGKWVNPRLLYARDGFSGLTPIPFEKKEDNHSSKKILETQWMPEIREAMRAVSQYGGTAGFIAPVDFPVFMKTGTGGNYRNGYHINYTGYGPPESGSIVFCVRVTGKRTSYRTRRAGYRVNQELLIRLKQLAETRSGRFWNE